MSTQLRSTLSVCLSVAVFAVFLFLIKTSLSPISQAQGYPASPANTPESVTGYPGPSSSPVAPTSTPVLENFVVNDTRYLPVLAQGANPRKGMVWRFYSGMLNISGTNLNPFNTVSIGWFHRYAPHNDGMDLERNGQIKFIPFWPCNQFDIEYMQKHLPDGYDGYLLWLNEPETGMGEGCPAMQTANAAAVWYIEVRAAFPNAKFIGPHTYHQDPNSHLRAMEYVDDWRDIVHNLTGSYPDVAGYGIHLFADNKDINLDYLDDYYDMMLDWGEGNKELWITEFSYCLGSPGEAAQELTETVNDLESSPYDYVSRYAYWQDMANPLAEDDPMDPTVCTEPLFDDYTTLSATGTAYSQVGNTP